MTRGGRIRQDTGRPAPAPTHETGLPSWHSRRKSSETTSSSTLSKGLRKTMPTRFADGDPRGTGHETDYQASRGGWLRSTKPTPDNRR